MPTTRIAYLFGRYFDKTATAEERAEFMSLVTAPEHQEAVHALMEQYWDALAEGEDFFNSDQSEAMLLAALEAGSETAGALNEPLPSIGRRPLRRLVYLGAAAVVVLAIGIGWWRYAGNRSGFRVANGPVLAKADVVNPGTNKAILILGDGSKVKLDSVSKGQLATQGGTAVVQQGGGQVAYELNGGNPVAPGSVTQAQGGAAEAQGATNAQAQGGTAEVAVTYNTIVTPRGGQYKVSLPDGTKVWLNAASSLRFPTAFTGKSREVELTGEGYFEVAGDPHHPFRVKVNQANVDVLGTRFDIMAYPDEPTMNTSLLQGAVRVQEAGLQALPQPGEEVIFNPTALTMKVGPVDTDQAVAWKNGLFLFEGVTIDKVMRQLARWYDIQFSIEGNIAYHYSGGFSRNAPLYDVLRTLELGVRARFEQDGSIIRIKPVP
jgi:ferric-dicitrate binding protein FerR (iron transport regulator)